MSLIESIIIMILLSGTIIFALYSMLSDFWFIDKNNLGRNHCGIVTFNSSGGDIHFDDMSQEELAERLKSDYEMFSYNDRPCVNAEDSTHLAEYRMFVNRKGRVKTIGYVTKDKVVFEGKEYYFD